MTKDEFLQLWPQIKNKPLNIQYGHPGSYPETENVIIAYLDQLDEHYPGEVIAISEPKANKDLVFVTRGIQKIQIVGEKEPVFIDNNLNSYLP